MIRTSNLAEYSCYCCAMAQNHVQVNSHSPYEDEMEEEEEVEGDLTLFYFESLFRRDANERATFLNNFNKSVKKWIARPDELAAQRLLQAHLPTALRLSVNSPFEDIRDAVKRLLDELEVGTRSVGGLGPQVVLHHPCCEASCLRLKPN